MNSDRDQSPQVVLQAGGCGARIRPRSDDIPKAMLEINGVPIIGRLLTQLLRSGFRDIAVILGYKADVLHTYLTDFQSAAADRFALRLHREHIPHGNAGGLSLLPRTKRTILFIFSDLVTDLDFIEFLNVHRQHGSEVTLASHVDTYRLPFGELVVDNDRVEAYLEKPTKSYRICSGIAAFQPSILDLARAMKIPFGLCDLVQNAIARQHRVTHWEHAATWIDVNSEEFYKAAQEMQWSEIRQ